MQAHQAEGMMTEGIRPKDIMETYRAGLGCTLFPNPQNVQQVLGWQSVTVNPTAII